MSGGLEPHLELRAFEVKALIALEFLVSAIKASETPVFKRRREMVAMRLVNRAIQLVKKQTKE